MRKIFAILFVFIFTFLSAEALYIGSGQKGKGYYNLAHSIQKILATNSIKTKVLESKGSVENIIRLSNGETDLAIVQSDTAFYAEKGLHSFENANIDNIAKVITFYQEPFFIVTNIKNINNITQLKNYKINIGPESSGLAETAKVILNSANLWRYVTVRKYNIDTSIKLLRLNKLQAIVLNHINKKLLADIQSGNFSIVPISKDFIFSINKTFPYFFPYEYSINSGETVTTIATDAILIARKDLDKKLVEKITNILDKNYSSLEFPDNSLNNEHFSKNPLSSWHAGTLKFFDNNGIKIIDNNFFDIYFLYIVGAIILALLVIALLVLFIMQNADIFHRYHSSYMIINMLSKTLNTIIKYKYLFLSILIVIIYVIFLLLIKYFEHKWALQNNITSAFDSSSFSDSLSWLFVFGSSGYNGKIFPSSQGGQLVAAMVPLVGVGGLFAFVGFLTFDQLKKYILEVKGMSGKRFKDHIILCGWNKNSHYIIENLLHKNLTSKRQIVILAEEQYSEDISRYELDPMKVFYIQGNANSREDLDKANIKEADIAIVIQDMNSKDPDARTILKILTIEKYTIELEESGARKNRANIHTIAEIRDPQNIDIAKDAGVDQIISLGNIESKIFTQAVQNPGVAKFINEIMTYNDQNDIYSFDIKKGSKLFNKTYDEILITLREYKILLLSINIEHGKPKHNVDVLLKKYNLKKAIITNPIYIEEQNYKVQEGNLIIVLAQYQSIVDNALKELSN